MITYEDFDKIDLKTAKIILAERIEGSKKLIRLELDIGNGENNKRQIVAGIGKKYEPEFLIGKTIVIIANLEPITLMGVESNGMLLAAKNEEGNLSLITTMEEIEQGSDVS